MSEPQRVHRRPKSPRRARVARPRRLRIVVLEQLAMDLGPEQPRWSFSRLVRDSWRELSGASEFEPTRHG